MSKIKATVVIPDKAKAIHQALAEYFMGKWHGVEKPFKYTEAQMKKLGFKSPDSKADRKVHFEPKYLWYVVAKKPTTPRNLELYMLENAPTPSMKVS